MGPSRQCDPQQSAKVGATLTQRAHVLARRAGGANLSSACGQGWWVGHGFGPGAVSPLFPFLISVLFPNQKFNLNSNYGFNLRVSNLKPNSNTFTACTEIIYLLLLYFLLSLSNFFGVLHRCCA
jgi:hypothetical protein